MSEADMTEEQKRLAAMPGFSFAPGTLDVLQMGDIPEYVQVNTQVIIRKKVKMIIATDIRSGDRESYYSDEWDIVRHYGGLAIKVLPEDLRPRVHMIEGGVMVRGKLIPRET